MPSKIEWTDETWNPISGCTKVSPGCKNCYAERMARRLAGRYGYPEQPHHFDVTLHPDKLDLPLRWKKPRMVFPCSMSDLFHKDVPTEYIARVWTVMACSSKHTFQVLTKRPKRIAEFLNGCGEWEGWITHNGQPPKVYGGTGIMVGDDDRWPLPNVWLGVSVENQAAADERIPLLLQTPAAVRFVSCEPLLGEIDLSQSYQKYLRAMADIGSFIPDPEAPSPLHWLIAGGESGPSARPMKPDWARGLRDQCQQAGVPFFFKQWGEWLPESDSHGLWPERPNGDLIPNARQVHLWPDGTNSIRHGKKAAGRLLDGREWSQMPEVHDG